jgi:deoxyribodipyrimidine photo-lyase
MKKQRAVFWFRRDLRLTDNTGLFHALTSQVEVLPIFIFDTNILDTLPKDDARVTFIHQLLKGIQDELNTIGKSLAVFHGTPHEVFAQLMEEQNITAVYSNHDYEPAALQRDREVAELLAQKQIAFHTYKDQVVFERNEVIKSDGTPYVVFTPYAKRWKELYAAQPPFTHSSEDYLSALAPHSYPFLQLEDIGFEQSSLAPTPYDISSSLIDHYEQTRNFPALDRTSKLSAYLRFGAISIREVVRIASQSSHATFLNELIWREFFMQILWHFPHTTHKSFRELYDRIEWQNNEAHFEAWRNGQTGYPMVDAGMRELNATGHMHNRVRMVVASFLCKHLLIDWRWGEAYFALKLLDYEQASNVGNWQWAAGSGVDAAPYFRIFNPEEQVKKFDKDHAYIKKWIPELNTLNYPLPIVEHKSAREKCLRVYKKALE